MPTTPPRRRRHVWVFATVALALVAGGVAGFGLTRQSTAAAKSPASPSLASDSPTPPTSAPGGSSGTAATLPSGQDTLVLGDSLALIMYPWLADLLPDRYVSYAAQVGSSTGWALARLEQVRQDGERIPKVVLVSAGTNDFYAADSRPRSPGCWHCSARSAAWCGRTSRDPRSSTAERRPGVPAQRGPVGCGCSPIPTCACSAGTS